ncbi:cellulase family glycosylhydrolase [Cypionkella sp.]|uniref:cellulase family glycosylhydrolase n=1 Tax=Cypionkella sp. TaxID=2811411 RepID=UPI00271E5998|nr:cellulase family glycosylhydrolase [Cypionkella sp.]MDO8982160.1 cellulase family glycosylhydrolase [Cypionkella sp.]MDP2048607.1 cellulase family glycosylhydrolase [Cypionkella sp.]
MGTTAATTTSGIAMINIVMKAADGSGGAWQTPVQLIPQGMQGNPEQFVASIKIALPLVNNLRVQFNEYSFNADGSLHPQMERFLAAATAAGYQLTMVYAGGDAQNIGSNTEGWPALSNAAAYAALQANYSDVSGAWSKMLDWMDQHKTVEGSVYGWELMNEAAGYKHSVSANGTQGDLDKADFVKLYADHAIALTELIEARAAGKILVGGWGYNGDFLTLADTKIGGVSALDYLRAAVGDNLVWSSHLYPGWMGTQQQTTTAELSSRLDTLFASVVGDAVLITETNANGKADDPNVVLDENDLATASYEWFLSHGIGVGWFPGLQTGSSSLMVINADGSLEARHQHSLAHAMNVYSLAQHGTAALAAGQMVAVSLTKMTLRNEAYEVAAGEARFDTVQYAGFGFGYSGNDTINGHAISNDFLYGGTGNDLLSGLDGDDFLFGQDDADILSGGAGIDALFGGRGNDWLDGGTGRDQLYGGVGNDTYIVDQAADSVRELVGEGVDTVLSLAGVYSLNRPGLEAQTQVENLSFIGTGDFIGTGNALANRLIGGTGIDRLFGLAGQDSLFTGAGDDTLDGGAGSDQLVGGMGNDTYIVDQTADCVRELVGEGADTVLSLAGVYSLNRPGLEAQTQVENLSFIGAGKFIGTGNALGNQLVGGGGNDQLFGLAGQDSLFGGAGDDRFFSGTGADFLNGGLGADQFLFERHSGADRVMDFEDNVDVVLLRGFAGVSTVAQAFIHAVQNGANVVFTFGEGDVLTVLNTTKAALTDDLLII